jgi:rare lipoprotein A
VRTALLALMIAGLIAGGCSSSPKVRTVSPGYSEKGLASWYGGKFHGRATASGEIYDMHDMTAAHKTMPLGTMVEVKNLDNGRKVRVKVNDRGPFVKGRIIDLSFAAAKEIEMVGPGTANVKVVVLTTPRAASSSPPPSSRHSRWIVQAGAFQELSRAEALADDLAGEFKDVDVHRHGTYYRVEIGPWKKRKKADKAQRKLERSGHDAIVKAIDRS